MDNVNPGRPNQPFDPYQNGQRRTVPQTGWKPPAEKPKKTWLILAIAAVLLIAGLATILILLMQNSGYRPPYNPSGNSVANPATDNPDPAAPGEPEAKPGTDTQKTEAPDSTQADGKTDSPKTTIEDPEEKHIVVGATAIPHAEILESIKDALAEKGYTLEVVVYDDYMLPNKALEDKELDANYFQHTPFRDYFNEFYGTHLVSAAAIHYEPLALYGNGVTMLDAVAEGATILIPADGINETRALFLLQQVGLIKLPNGAKAGNGVALEDVVDDGGFKIVRAQADTIPAQLKYSDAGTLAVINGNYALEAKMDINDALAVEDAKGDAAQTFANVIAVRVGDENSPKIRVLVEALKTKAVKDFIDERYNGSVAVVF